MCPCVRMDGGNAISKDVGANRSSWNAHMGSVPKVRPDFSPLDASMGLPSEHVLPQALEWGLRLALGRSFDQAAEEMRVQHQVRLSGGTPKRWEPAKSNGSRKK